MLLIWLKDSCVCRLWDVYVIYIISDISVMRRGGRTHNLIKFSICVLVLLLLFKTLISRWKISDNGRAATHSFPIIAWSLPIISLFFAPCCCWWNIDIDSSFSAAADKDALHNQRKEECSELLLAAQSEVKWSWVLEAFSLYYFSIFPSTPPIQL